MSTIKALFALGILYLIKALFPRYFERKERAFLRSKGYLV